MSELLPLVVEGLNSASVESLLLGKTTGSCVLMPRQNTAYAGPCEGLTLLVAVTSRCRKGRVVRLTILPDSKSGGFRLTNSTRKAEATVAKLCKRKKIIK
jgi:hypothetical protein